MNNIIKRHLISTLFLYLWLHVTVQAQDLEKSFDLNKSRLEQIEIDNIKIKESSIEIECFVHADLGNSIFRNNNEIFRYTNKKLIKVASSKNGRFAWKEKVKINGSTYNIAWQLIERNVNDYTIYWQAVGEPVISQAGCKIVDGKN